MNIAMMYATTEATIAATMIENDFLTGNRNSADRQDMDSIPTKSHGAIMRTPRIWEPIAPPAGAKKGWSDETPPTFEKIAAPNEKTSPAASDKASTVCTAAATRRQATTAATMPIATDTMTMSPKHTLNPAIWYLNPKWSWSLPIR